MEYPNYQSDFNTQRLSDKVIAQEIIKGNQFFKASSVYHHLIRHLYPMLVVGPEVLSIVAPFVVIPIVTLALGTRLYSLVISSWVQKILEIERVRLYFAQEKGVLSVIMPKLGKTYLSMLLATFFNRYRINGIHIASTIIG